MIPILLMWRTSSYWVLVMSAKTQHERKNKKEHRSFTCSWIQIYISKRKKLRLLACEIPFLTVIGAKETFKGLE